MGNVVSYFLAKPGAAVVEKGNVEDTDKKIEEVVNLEHEITEETSDFTYKYDDIKSEYAKKEKETVTNIIEDDFEVIEKGKPHNLNDICYEAEDVVENICNELKQENESVEEHVLYPGAKEETPESINKTTDSIECTTSIPEVDILDLLSESVARNVEPIADIKTDEEAEVNVCIKDMQPKPKKLKQETLPETANLEEIEVVGSIQDDQEDTTKLEQEIELLQTEKPSAKTSLEQYSPKTIKTVQESTPESLDMETNAMELPEVEILDQVLESVATSIEKLEDKEKDEEEEVEVTGCVKDIHQEPNKLEQETIQEIANIENDQEATTKLNQEIELLHTEESLANTSLEQDSLVATKNVQDRAPETPDIYTDPKSVPEVETVDPFLESVAINVETLEDKEKIEEGKMKGCAKDDHQEPDTLKQEVISDTAYIEDIEGVGSIQDDQEATTKLDQEIELLQTEEPSAYRRLEQDNPELIETVQDSNPETPDIDTNPIGVPEAEIINPLQDEQNATMKVYQEIRILQTKEPSAIPNLEQDEEADVNGCVKDVHQEPDNLEQETISETAYIEDIAVVGSIQDDQEATTKLDQEIELLQTEKLFANRSLEQDNPEPIETVQDSNPKTPDIDTDPIRVPEAEILDPVQDEHNATMKVDQQIGILPTKEPSAIPSLGQDSPKIIKTVKDSISEIPGIERDPTSIPEILDLVLESVATNVEQIADKDEMRMDGCINTIHQETDHLEQETIPEKDIEVIGSIHDEQEATTKLNQEIELLQTEESSTNTSLEQDILETIKTIQETPDMITNPISEAVCKEECVDEGCADTPKDEDIEVIGSIKNDHKDTAEETFKQEEEPIGEGTSGSLEKFETRN